LGSMPDEEDPKDGNGRATERSAEGLLTQRRHARSCQVRYGGTSPTPVQRHISKVDDARTARRGSPFERMLDG